MVTIALTAAAAVVALLVASMLVWQFPNDAGDQKAWSFASVVAVGVFGSLVAAMTRRPNRPSLLRFGIRGEVEVDVYPVWDDFNNLLGTYLAIRSTYIECDAGNI